MAKSKSAKKVEPDQADTTPAQQTQKLPFESLYLQQMSKEFADDLDRLRKANDFKGERSIQLLVEALKQGTACFSEEEVRRITRD